MRYIFHVRCMAIMQFTIKPARLCAFIPSVASISGRKGIPHPVCVVTKPASAGGTAFILSSRDYNTSGKVTRRCFTVHKL